MQFYNDKLKILIKALFTSHRKINAVEFLENWEKRYQDFHDPGHSEVYSRLKIIINFITIPNPTFIKLEKKPIEPKYVLELGAGYGRITKHLVRKIPIKSIEPNDLLFNHLTKVNTDSLKHSFLDIDEKHLFYKDILIAFSVRSLVYLNLVQSIIFLRKLQKITKILIVFENRIGIKRLQIAGIFAPKLRIVKIECYN